ncbi:MAG: enoyl-CoA hydratase-related protein, partial [Deltaproteobacteria bacterium]
VIPVTRSVGRKRALELLLYGELIPAQRALEMGLVNRVVPASDLESETRRWAADLARRSPVGVQLSKKAFYAAADLEYRKAFEYMGEAFARLCTTEDAGEGVRAFLEKRDPTWKGR